MKDYIFSLFNIYLIANLKIFSCKAQYMHQPHPQFLKIECVCSNVTARLECY